MNVGMVVEGTFDDASYRKLIPRIRKDITNPQIRQCGGKHRLKNVFLDHLEEFQRNSAWDIDVAFVIRDSDCERPEQIEEDLQGILTASRFKPRFRVKFFAAQCMLESWLLSDLVAIRNVAMARHKNVGIELQNIQIAPQHSKEDKDILLRVLAQYGLRATPVIYAEIAALADLGVISQRCQYFRDFRNRINRA